MTPKLDYSDVAFRDDGKLKLLIIVGTRPEIIRLAEVIKKCRRFFDCVLAHTGQNYDYNLNGVFFKDLKLADPDVYMDAVGDDLGETIGNHVLDNLSPFHGSGELGDEVTLDFLRVGVRKRVNILVNGANRSSEVGFLDSIGEHGVSRLHERRVESATHLENESAASAGFFHLLASSLNTGNGTGNYHLSGAVVVGRSNDVVDSSADFLNFLVGQSEDSRHSRRSFLTSTLHSHCTSGYELQTLLEGENTGSDKSRKFAERVTGNHVGLEIFAHSFCQNHRVQENSRLSNFGLFQFILGTGKHDVGDAET